MKRRRQRERAYMGEAVLVGVGGRRRCSVCTRLFLDWIVDEDGEVVKGQG